MEIDLYVHKDEVNNERQSRSSESTTTDSDSKLAYSPSTRPLEPIVISGKITNDDGFTEMVNCSFKWTSAIWVVCWMENKS